MTGMVKCKKLLIGLIGFMLLMGLVDPIKWSLNLKTLDYEKDFVCNYRMFVGRIIIGLSS